MNGATWLHAILFLFCLLGFVTAFRDWIDIQDWYTGFWAVLFLFGGFLNLALACSYYGVMP
jgi:hypothetical protein